VSLTTASASVAAATFGEDKAVPVAEAVPVPEAVMSGDAEGTKVVGV
jgi:hypothetical protein